MSKKRKKTRGNPARLRATALLPEGMLDGIPAAAVDAYVEVFGWAADHPGPAAELAALTQDDIQLWCVGIARAKQYGYPEVECLDRALQIKYWHILNGFTYFYDWWQTPVALMSPQEIVDQIRLDATTSEQPPNRSDAND